jgi:hypothetical protein
MIGSHLPPGLDPFGEPDQGMAGIATLVMLFSIFCFALLIRLNQWPNRGSSFNVWINLPTFDPTTGGDVVKRLRRDSLVNVILGVFAPFVLPVVAVVAANHIEINVLSSPHALVWGITLWMFIPLSMLMRGLAMSRVADMIGQRRARLTASVHPTDRPRRPCRASRLLLPRRPPRTPSASPSFTPPCRATGRACCFATSWPGTTRRFSRRCGDRRRGCRCAAPAGHGFRRRADGPDRAGRGARRAGCALPHRFAAPPNTGRPTGVDLDGDGRSWRARDAHGYGLFSGDGGMAILSRVPIGAVRDFSDLPWMALPESAAGPSRRPRRSTRSACTPSRPGTWSF